MQRFRPFLTFLCITTAVAALFFWYRNTTTAYDSASLKVTDYFKLSLNAVEGRLYLFYETIAPPDPSLNWGHHPILDGHSQWSYADGDWDQLQFHELAGFGVGRHAPPMHLQRWVATGFVVPMWFVAVGAMVYPVRRLISGRRQSVPSKAVA